MQPFLDKYCTNCHGGDKPKADLDLRPYASLNSVVRDFPRWSQLAEKLVAKEMPPEKSDPAARRRSKQQVIDWIAAVRSNEARKHAGDPGTVLARRLSNAEYNYTIRDLTGVDIRPTREFPVDPANPAGFDNSGESLAMSPGAAEEVPARPPARWPTTWCWRARAWPSPRTRCWWRPTATSTA